MSRYHGTYYRGAAKETKRQKRNEAERRAHPAEIHLLEDIYAYNEWDVTTTWAGSFADYYKQPPPALT